MASVSAAAISGALAGAAAGLISSLLPVPVRVSAGLLAASAVAVGALGWLPVLPEFNRETEQALLGLGPIRWAIVNGSLLGLGFTSRIGFWIWYLIPAGILAAGSPAAGAAIWGGYGFTRLAVAAGLARRMRRTPDRMPAISTRVLQLRQAARRLAGPVTVGAAAAVMLWLGL